MLSATYSPSEIADRWACKVDKVLMLINRGELGAINTAPGGAKKPRWRISAESLEAFERDRSTKPAPPKARRRARESYEFI